MKYYNKREMAFRVFLSHSLDPAEQALAWRLQTLAAAHGIEMFVPHRDGSHPSLSALTSVHQAIDRADCVMAIITARPNASVQSELRYALGKPRPVIPIVSTELRGHPLLAQFKAVFWFSPSDNPGEIEAQIVAFLKQQDISRSKQQAIGALAALGLGLLLLFSLSEK